MKSCSAVAPIDSRYFAAPPDASSTFCRRRLSAPIGGTIEGNCNEAHLNEEVDSVIDWGRSISIEPISELKRT